MLMGEYYSENGQLSNKKGLPKNEKNNSLALNIKRVIIKPTYEQLFICLKKT